MRTRRDQVQAYRFVTRRIVSAMLSGEPEAAERPMRRLALSVFASSMVAALVVAGVGVWGLVTGQNSELADDANAMIIASDTRARFVHINGTLYPVPNIASARLILGEPSPQIRELSRDALSEYPRGQLVGIPLAPDDLPPADHLVELPWQVCSVPPSPEAPESSTTVVLGRELAGGEPLGERAFYAAGADDYVLWSDRSLRLVDNIAIQALGLAATEPTPVTDQLVNALQAGPDLDTVVPEGFNQPADVDFQLEGRTPIVGFIYQSGDQHYVMTKDGLVPIGDVTLALRLAVGSARVRTITGGEALRAQASSDYLEPEGYPLEVPELHPMNGTMPTICGVYRGPSEEAPAVTVEFHSDPPGLLSSRESVPLRQTGDEVAAADRMFIPPDQGALVRQASVSGADQPEDTVFLITAQGYKYRLGDGAREALGYDEVDPVPVPANLLALVPTGPLLDTASAQRGIDPDDLAQLAP